VKEFIIQEFEKAGEDRLGDPIFEWTEKCRAKGYMDLLSGKEATDDKNFLAKATHVAIIFDSGKPITNRDRLIHDGTAYEITYVDNPMGLGSHLEVFVKGVE